MRPLGNTSMGAKTGLWSLAGRQVQEHFMSNIDVSKWDLVVEDPAPHISCTIGRRPSKQWPTCQAQCIRVSSGYERLSDEVMMIFSGTKYSEEMTTTPFLSMQRDSTILFITQDYKMIKAVYYRILYEKGLGKLTYDERVENGKKGYDEGLGKLTYDERVETYEKGLGKHNANMAKMKEEHLEWLAGVTDSEQEDEDVIAFSNAYTELCDKISEARKGKKHSAETREKISEALKGKTHSVETRDKRSGALKGRVLSAEHRENISIAKTGRVDMAKWDENFSKLKKYKESNGHCNVPQGTPLGSWVNAQRTEYRKKTLKNECIEKLDELGFEWSIYG